MNQFCDLFMNNAEYFRDTILIGLGVSLILFALFFWMGKKIK